MNRFSDKFNALPIDQRKIIIPVMNQTRIRDLKAMREQLVIHHKSQIGQLDALIKRLAATEQEVIDD